MNVPRSRTKNRIKVRTPSGKVVTHFRRKKNGKPTCPSGRPLPGTVRGTPVEVVNTSRTARRPSRPYGGVLSSPAMRSVMRERVAKEFTAGTKDGLFVVGAVCMKIAGRDAGELCVVTEDLGKGFVKVSGDTRERKVNTRHLEPIGKHVDVKRGSAKQALASLKA